MKMIPVKSSMICAVGYDSKTREMNVVFTTGATYRYLEVDEKDYRGLLEAASKGSYMNKHIIGKHSEYSIA